MTLLIKTGIISASAGQRDVTCWGHLTGFLLPFLVPILLSCRPDSFTVYPNLRKCLWCGTLTVQLYFYNSRDTAVGTQLGSLIKTNFAQFNHIPSSFFCLQVLVNHVFFTSKIKFHEKTMESSAKFNLVFTLASRGKAIGWAEREQQASALWVERRTFVPHRRSHGSQT
jgi:hypothetical protein